MKSAKKENEDIPRLLTKELIRMIKRKKKYQIDTSQNSAFQ